VVHGSVQGVFFRDTTRRWALEHSLAGWVCNRPDGTVEVVLEGTETRVDRVLGLLERGPDGADVESVEVTAENPSGLEDFEIR
jgi:acylphosphatase